MPVEPPTPDIPLKEEVKEEPPIVVVEDAVVSPVSVCMCVWGCRKEKKVPDECSTTSDTSSKHQQAQCKEKYNCVRVGGCAHLCSYAWVWFYHNRITIIAAATQRPVKISSPLILLYKIHGRLKSHSVRHRRSACPCLRTRRRLSPTTVCRLTRRNLIQTEAGSE